MSQYKEHDLVMLPTKDRTSIMCKNSKHLILVNNLSSGDMNFLKGQHLYITSNEEIKDGDWFIGDNISLHQCTLNNASNINFKGGWYSGSSNCKKIIATTDKSLKIYESETLASASGFNLRTEDILLPQIPQRFIEHFITEYNKGNIIDKVLVEYKEDVEQTKVKNSKISFSVSKYHPDNSIYTPVINPDNTINIKSIDPKLYTRDEVIEILKTFAIDCSHDEMLYHHYAGEYKDLNNWIKENLKQ